MLLFWVKQTEQSYKRDPKFLDQLTYCEKNAIPLAAVLGQGELENNQVKLRIVAVRDEEVS